MSLNKKFDIQLSNAKQDELRLSKVFNEQKLAKIELKSESYQWEQTGNICVEYEHNGQPSGLAATEADVWVHELKRDGETLMYMMFPTERLKLLCRKAYKAGMYRINAGDDGKSKVVLLDLSELLKEV